MEEISVTLSPDAAMTFSREVKMIDVCNEIAGWINRTCDRVPVPITGMAVFEMSPTGELFPVFQLFEKMLRDKDYQAYWPPEGIKFILA